MAKLITNGRQPADIKAANEKRKEEEKKKPLPKPAPVKKFYDIKVEALVPCELTYRVLADDEKDALEQMKKKPPTGFKPRVMQKRLVKATVYEGGTLIIKSVKNY